MNRNWAKLAYAAIFCGALPWMLWQWTFALDRRFTHLPVQHAPLLGLVLALAGLTLMLWAMWDLWSKGGGLPMNAYPPPRFVATGAYRLLPHPIYFGFGLLVPGAMIALGRPTGLWIVTPVTWLAMVALVVGYERIDLQRRFGPSHSPAWLALPPASANPPDFAQRAATLVIALIPWLLVTAASMRLTAGEAAGDTMLPFDRHWPVRDWTSVFYLGAYGWTMLAPAGAKTQAALRHFAGTALWGTALITWCFLVFSCSALPLFHVFWAFAAAELWSDRLGRNTSLGIALLIAAGCIALDVHSLPDVITGWFAYYISSHRGAIWDRLRIAAERIANSWYDWRFGPVRVINHGAYVAGAMTLGLWLVGLLLGPAYAPAIITLALCSLFGAGAWGQWLEASSQLSRPFGYYGGLFGGCLGAILVQLCWGEGWAMLGAFAVAAPLIQGVGRLRCLVQGCCHGRPASADWLGIRHTQPLSRVCKLANLSGVPIYPTPLYSILGNGVIIGLVLRLWLGGAALACIAGAYFILSTCARFMEEGYRGEPQTVRCAGLPIYQWLAIGCLIVGMTLTTLPSPTPPAWTGWSLAPLLYALPIGLLAWFCMGVDVPASQRRMSRLA